ncbi:DUF2267 domain-containing protein [Nocardia pseudobrasiliensis]|uniref:Uncharacterized protein (DUF2267 family) n=1 Tax=Nocardia pseudobrasiliensis TaxID=45979 RepID=A0A370ICF6_9NOCA|nr:DUF2267 domain-containing protein [Nocardia pseudobrasiliensis]RDI68290.1 uncharacterized protein (DUF2267 family) [Nocardia pseudobrasiliensis]
MPYHHDPLAPAVHTAHIWVHAVADALNTEDRAFAHRALRAWLHTVRDQLGVSAAAHLSAQLPELLRGTFFEGWMPNQVPAPHDATAFVNQFAATARVTADEAAALIGAVTEALTDLFSPGQLEHVFTVLPADLRKLLRGSDLDGTFGPDADATAYLRARVRTLTEAVAVLAHALEQLPGAEQLGPDGISAAEHAHRILVAEGLTDRP